MTGRCKHLQLVKKCGKWWEIQSAQIDERPASDASSEPSSDTGLDNPQVINDIEIDMNESELYKEWEGEVSSIPETTDEGLFSRTGAVKLDDTCVEDYPGAALVMDTGPNLYDQLWDSDEHYKYREVGGPYYPFAGHVEWEVVQWLNSLDVPMEKINGFFDLTYVCSILLSYIELFLTNNIGERPAIFLFVCPRTEVAH